MIEWYASNEGSMTNKLVASLNDRLRMQFSLFEVFDRLSSLFGYILSHHHRREMREALDAGCGCRHPIPPNCWLLFVLDRIQQVKCRKRICFQLTTSSMQATSCRTQIWTARTREWESDTAMMGQHTFLQQLLHFLMFRFSFHCSARCGVFPIRDLTFGTSLTPEAR